MDHLQATAPGWALVTGASAGIGEAIARELARRRWNLVLTARRRERLEALAAELGRSGVETRVLVSDLAEPAAPAVIEAWLAAQGIAIELLVNNAGYGLPGFYHKTAWADQQRFLQVMLAAPCELAHRLLPGMRARRRGYVLNVASLAGLIPGSAGNTLYGAVKAFLVSFSQSLALENRDLGIRVSALCPGFTVSEFHDVSQARHLVERLPRWMWMSSEEVARRGLDALFAGRVVYVPGTVNRLIRFLAKHLPDRLALALMARQSRRFRRRD
ncbi:MAG: SDR family oxidoreductase [Xanthomonadales bacterium]|nr:SDR family oxidoreductase [Xanthomonadales bacterium]